MRRPPFCSASLLLLLAGLSSRVAAAEGEDAGPPARTRLSEALTGDAKDAYEAATVLMNNRDCAHAIAKYEEAYDSSKDARLLFDIAICHRDLRQYARMQAMLVRYEQEDTALMTADQKADAEAAIAAIHNLVGTLHLSVNETNAEVSVDGELVGTTPLATPLILDLGRHLLAVKKPGFEPEERLFEIAGGNEMSLSIGLEHHVRPARLHVVAEPGATIVIDERELARGSYDGALPPGSHAIAITEAGKKDYATRIDLADGEARTLQITLESERRAAIWPWLAGGAAVLVGAGIGGYFLFRQQDTRGPGPQGELPTVTIPGH